MKRPWMIVTLLLISVCTLVLVFASPQFSARERKTIVIRITSSDPNEELTFAAAYLFRTKESSLLHIEEKTPFEIKEQSNFVSGIFRKTSGSGLLRVAVLTSVGEEPEQNQAGGAGDIIIIGTQPERNYHISAQALSQQ